MQAQALHAVHLLADCAAIPWVNGKLSEVTHTIVLGVFVFVLIVLAIAVILHRTLKAFVVAFLFAALASWAVAGGGIQWGANKIGGETNGSTVSQLLSGPSVTQTAC